MKSKYETITRATFRFPDSQGMEKKNVIPQFHESPKNENHHGIGIPTHT